MTKDNGKELEHIISQAKLAMHGSDNAVEELRSSMGNLHQEVSPP